MPVICVNLSNKIYYKQNHFNLFDFKFYIFKSLTKISLNILKLPYILIH